MQLSWRNRIVALAALGTVAFGGVAAQAAGLPKVVNRIGAGAPMVIVINNLHDLSGKLAALGQTINIPIPPDPVAMGLDRMGMTQGVNQNGSAAFVFVSMPHPGTPGGPRMVALLPATSVKTMLSSLSPAPAKNGIMQLTLPNQQPGYAAKVGKFAAIAQHKSDLQKFLKEKTKLSSILSPDAKQQLEHNNAEIYVNMAKASPQIIQGIKRQERQQAQTAASNPATKQQMAQARMVMAMVIKYLPDVKSAIVAVRFGAHGVSITDSAQTKAHSPLAKLIADSKPLGKHPLAGLPTHELIHMAFTWNGPAMTEFIKNLKMPGLQSNQAATLKVLSLMSSNFVSERAALLSRSAAPSTGLVHGVAIMKVKNAKAYIASEPRLMKIAAANGAQAGASMTVTPNAVTVDGISFTKVVTDLNTSKLAAQGNPQQQAMIKHELKMMFGKPGGITSYSGRLDGQHVLVAFNEPKSKLRSFIASARSKKDATPSGGKTLRGEILPHDFMVGYVPVGRLMHMAIARMQAAQNANNGQGNNGQGNGQANGGAVVGQPASPMVVSANQDHGNVMFRMVLPNAQLRAISTEGHMLFAMMMMGGMQQQ